MAGKDWIKRVAPAGAQEIAGRATSRISQGAAGAADRARAMGQHITSTAGGMAGEVHIPFGDLLARHELPTPALEPPWRLSLGELLASHPQVPARLTPVLGRLDGLGEIALSAQSFGLDGQRVTWSDIQSVSFAPAIEMLGSQALDRELARLMALIPAVPGRRWLIRQVLDLLMGICLAAAVDDEALAAARLREVPRPEDDATVDRPATLYRLVPTRVTYRASLRARQLTPGIFITMALAARPDFGEAVIAAATSRGVQVMAAETPRAVQRASGMRAVAASIQNHFAQAAPPDDPQPEP